MTWAVLLTLAHLGQFPTVDSQDFAKAQQATALLSTVRIVNLTNKFRGTGAILKSAGGYTFILTAEHVVDQAEALEIATFSADSYPRPDRTYRGAEVVAKLHDPDLALLRLSTRDRPPGGLKICPPKLVPKEMPFPVMSVGCSLGEPPTILVDRVLDKKRVRKQPLAEPTLVWEAATKHSPGRSGGPLLDQRGNIIGVCTGRTGNFGFYCHTQEIHQWLKKNGFEYLYEDQ